MIQCEWVGRLYKHSGNCNMADMGKKCEPRIILEGWLTKSKPGVWEVFLEEMALKLKF